MNCVQAAQYVPDEMVRAFGAHGTPDQVRERIEPLVATGQLHVYRSAQLGNDTREISEKGPGDCRYLLAAVGRRANLSEEEAYGFSLFAG